MNEGIHTLEPSDELDLHHFKACEAKELIDEFIWSCKQSGFTGVVLYMEKEPGVHDLTHARLKASKLVKSFNLGGSTNTQNWGKTTFDLI